MTEGAPSSSRTRARAGKEVRENARRGAQAPVGGQPTASSQLPEARPVIDVARSRQEYKRLAGFYDLLAVPWLTTGVRREAVARLELRPGDSVLDLGCGTGLTLPLLVEAVGTGGRVVGVDLSEDQLSRARQRVAAGGWQNATLVEANAEELALNEQFDGLLSSYTHDIMTSPLAVARAVDHLKPGGRFVALGFVRPTGLRSPLNLLFIGFYKLFNVPVNWHAQTSSRPWANLERALGSVRVKQRFLGTWYRAVAVKLPQG